MVVSWTQCIIFEVDTGSSAASALSSSDLVFVEKFNSRTRTVQEGLRGGYLYYRNIV